MRRRRYVWVVVTIISLLIGLGSYGTAAPVALGDHKLHPALRMHATTRPNDRIRVLVQVERGKKLSDAELPPGATRRSSFSFINTEVVEVPGAAVQRLAVLPQIRFISHDAGMQLTSAYSPVTAFPYAAQLDQSLWLAPYAGQGVGVAVLDTGGATHSDFGTRKVDVNLGPEYVTGDANGHGTHVAGIIAGQSADGRYVGIAPQATIYSIGVVGTDGALREGNLIKALEWVYNNHTAYNIRIVNISIQSSLAQSYRTSPLSAAVEQLWFRGVVVVVSSGNKGTASDAVTYPPTNDPYVITVGAFSDNGTADRADDFVPTWSGRGTTQDGFAKPDLLAPGHRIVAPLAPNSALAVNRSSSIVDGTYIQLSGTSMATPVVSGMVANLLSFNPALTPDQVKWLLVTHSYGSGLLDAKLVWDAVNGQPASSFGAANQNLTPNEAFANAGSDLSTFNVFTETVAWETVAWETVAWETILLED